MSPQILSMAPIFFNNRNNGRASATGRTIRRHKIDKLMDFKALDLYFANANAARDPTNTENTVDPIATIVETITGFKKSSLNKTR